MSYPGSVTINGILWNRDPVSTDHTGEPMVIYKNTTDPSVHITIHGWSDYYRWVRSGDFHIRWPRNNVNWNYEYNKGESDAWSQGSNNGPDLNAADVIAREFWKQMK